MKKYKFTLGERHRMIVMLNDFKGSLDALVALLDDVKKLKIDDKEWEKGERKTTMVKNEKGEDIPQWQWSEEKGGEKEMELEKETVKYLMDTIEKKDKDGEITLADFIYIQLKDKLK